jgi:hypothetical protein
VVDATERIPPALRIVLPTSASVYRSLTNRLDVAGIASDNVGVTLIRVRNTRSPGEYTAVGTTNWLCPGLPLHHGVNRISAIASDAAGNCATAVLAVACHADPQYGDLLLSGAVVQGITFPDNLTPGSTVPIRWKVFSYVPVVSRVHAGVRGDWECFRDGVYVGYAESPWNLNNRHAGVYHFECNWPVPRKSGDANVWFSVAQTDGSQFMIAGIPDGVDSRSDPTYPKLIVRTILPGGDGTPPESDADAWTATEAFESENDRMKRAGCTVTGIVLPDGVKAGARIACEWKVLSYIPVAGQVLLLNLDQKCVWQTAEGASAGPPTETAFAFVDSSTGQRHVAREYRFRAALTAPEQPGEHHVAFRCRDGANAGSAWMMATISAQTDPRPVSHGGVHGRFIARTVVP